MTTDHCALECSLHTPGTDIVSKMLNTQSGGLLYVALSSAKCVAKNGRVDVELGSIRKEEAMVKTA